MTTTENDPTSADLREITALRNIAKEHAEVLAQFEKMAVAYQRREGQQDFSAIGELMGSILHGERVWGDDVEPKPDPEESYGEASAPIRDIREEREMKARAVAEMERHEKRQIAKDEQNIRLSAASIARDVLGPRSTTPPAQHHAEFFDLAKEIAGWLTNGA